MIDLNQLRTLKKHPLKPVFKSYKVSNLAEHLSVSPGHLSNVLNGVLRPSPALNQKITALASDIQAAERSTHSKDSK